MTTSFKLLQSLPHDIQSFILGKTLDILYNEKIDEWRKIHRENFKYCIKIFPQKFSTKPSIPHNYFSIERLFSMRLPVKDTYIITAKWLWDPNYKVFKFKGTYKQ